ncbi:hypothetical protein Tco_0669137 [Tanacetum coccineum]
MLEGKIPSATSGADMAATWASKNQSADVALPRRLTWLGYEVAGSDGGSEGSVVGSGHPNQQRSIWNDTWRLLVGGSSCKRLAYEERNPKPIIGNNEPVGGAKKTKIPLVLGCEWLHT